MPGPDKKGPAAEVREFLSTRRARITPVQAGLPGYGGHRRVAGLRREEVALLAGTSVDYYVRLERGNFSGASDPVLESLAHALHLSEAALTHLYDLARASTPSGRRTTVTSSRVRPTILRLLDSMTGVPAFVRNARLDIVAADTLGRALCAPVFELPLFAQRGPVDSARFMFLDAASKEFRADWDKGGRRRGRLPAHRDGPGSARQGPDRPGELTTRSGDFARLWARHDVKFHRSGVKNLHHPLVGGLVLPCEAMDLPHDPGLRLTFYTPEPDSPEREALGLLAGCTTTGTVVPYGTD
ncbi:MULTISPECIES: helix-turn-helix domain-containing protein [unclassified Streptomyces]|uniref:helix-turn-helix domain-containing protein n=1 Tax=unclassified Streptomyces TaxID=2593676 RepID=UPI0035DA3A0E